MMNGCFVVGTVMESPTVIKGSDHREPCSMIVQTDRMFRNEDGSLDEDFFFVEVWRGIAEEVRDCCQIGTVVAIRGRMVSKKREDGSYDCHIIAEHVTYPHRRSVITKTKV